MRKKLAIFSIAAVLFLAACGKGFQYKQIAVGTNQESIEKELGKKPDSTKEETGMTYLQYDTCSYLDYKGTATYCLTEDALNYSKWEYPAESSQNAKDAYKAAKENLQKEYGDGEENTDNETFWVCSWYLDKESTISLTCTSASNEYTVAILSTITGEEKK